MTMNLVLLPDLIRQAPAFPDGFFDLIREPIRQGCGVDIGVAPRDDKVGGLQEGFDAAHFRKLALGGGGEWSTRYHRISDPACSYLLVHLPANALMLSFEMPPWLITLCIRESIAFIDIRVSPLRFGRDLYIALRCSDADMRARIGGAAVVGDELRLEAAVLAANVRMHQRRMEDERGHVLTDLEGALLFVGQAPYDASLLTDDGRSLRCEDFAEELRARCATRRLLYKPHPFAGQFAQDEREALERITGQTPGACLQNAYQVLSAQQDVQLVSISSGMLQEAEWFDKTAHTLFRPFVPLADAACTATQAYQQIHFKSLLAPGFWHQLLSPERVPPRLAELPPLMHHHARETIDQWWDYSKVLTWERTLPSETVARNGLARLRERVEALEQRGPFSTTQINSASVHLALDSATPDEARWQRCVQEIRQQIAAAPLQFGRGQLYQGHEGWQLPGQRPTLQRLAEYRVDSWLPAHASVLDIGCNIGMFGLALSPVIRHYHGIDHTPALIDIAQRMAAARGIDNCHFECSSFADFMATQQQRYDVIFSFAVHVWIGMPIAEYAAVLHDLLAPGGRLILESNNLATNDTTFFATIPQLLDAGFRVHSRGLLKDDGIIERAFYVFDRLAEPAH
ncbi:class I SAM-dependent methyltransferase [Xanthomonas campestris]|uniref:class I SAM-dependent methyltransferase n=1 Tax=Xanthomonas campestris TaxID=339 RepID=UPI001E4F5F6E|nr:methyltransferase domain-containing protein [Xanthomonas campestris]MCC5071517.1 class I SAM-dependent methyltransferase [Xanthomonas campestris pv. plantaginis]